MKSAKLPEFPYTVKVTGIGGVSATIYRQEQLKGSEKYESFALSYSLLGKRKQQRFADFNEAKTAGEAAVKRIANGEQAALELRNSDRYEYQRAKEITAALGVTLDF